MGKGWRYLIAEATFELSDVTNTTWSPATLLGYVNDTMLQFALVRPDSMSKIASMQLATGSKQTVPTDGLIPLTVIRNMGADGATPGRVVTITDRGSLDSVNPNWHTQYGQVIQNYVYDSRWFDTFYVYPPVAPGAVVWIELNYCARPTVLTDPAQNLPLDDIFYNPAKNWLKYLCLVKERDDATSKAEADSLYQKFVSELGIEGQAAAANKPN